VRVEADFLAIYRTGDNNARNYLTIKPITEVLDAL